MMEDDGRFSIEFHKLKKKTGCARRLALIEETEAVRSNHATSLQRTRPRPWPRACVPLCPALSDPSERREPERSAL